MRLAAFLLVFVSCAGSEIPDPENAHSEHVMSLVGRFGIGHACAVNGQVLTAAHVAEVIVPDGRPMRFSYAYQGEDRTGFVSPAWVLRSRDIAGLRVDHGDPPRMNEISEREPIVGDIVCWYEYDLEAPGVLEIVRREKEITSLAAGHGSVGMTALPGASGSCAFDDTGRVVGLMVWRLGIPPRWEGVIVLLTGRWWPVRERD